MTKSTTLKKILPAILIIAILATGFFGAFGVDVVMAQSGTPPTDDELRMFIIDRYGDFADYRKQATDPSTPRSRLETIVEQSLRAELGRKGYQASQIDSQIDSYLNDGVLLSSIEPLDESFKTERAGRIEVSGTGCYIFWGFNLSKCLSSIFGWIGDLILSFFAMIVGIAGLLLNLAVKFTIVNMGTHVDNIGAITEGWKIFRDLANIILIFVLLAIGIATILRLEQYGMKALLAKLIIVALLINFSLFFTKVIIDASNILALRFYNQIELDGQERFSDWDGIGDSYQQAFKLTTVYQVKEGDNKVGFDFSSLYEAGNVTWKIFLITMLASILFLVAAFALFAGAFLLIMRFVMLVFLMVLSPLAFVGMILPATAKYAGQWWSMLLHQSFFAPIYLLLTWFVVKVINSPAFQASVGIGGKEGRAAFAGVVEGGVVAKNSIDIFLNFFIVIVFIIASLIIAQKLGIAGSSTVIKWGQSARKWGQGMVWRGSKRGVGRTADMALDENSWINRKTGGAFRKVSGAPLVGRGFAKVSAWGEAEKSSMQKKYEKTYSKYSDAGLQAASKDPTIIGVKKKALKNVMEQKAKEKSRKDRDKRDVAELEDVEKKLKAIKPSIDAYKQNIKNQISQIDSDIEDIQTNITAVEYELAETTRTGNQAAIDFAKLQLNGAKKTKAQKLVEKQKAAESLSEVEKLEKRKVELEEKQERRGETEGLRSSISGISTGGGGKSTP